MDISHISTGSKDLNSLIGGGMEKRILIQYYGEPGCGKSTVCILAAVECLKSGRHVIIIDTEGFSVERFRQIAGEDAEQLAELLLLFEPIDFDQQGIMIGECDQNLKTKNVGLIILDSATALYRIETGNSGEPQRKLTTQLIRLLGYAKRFNIPVIITNQVFQDIGRDQLSGLGGTGLRHISKIIVKIEKKNGHMAATLEKHRSQPEGNTIEFEIVNEGIRRV